MGVTVSVTDVSKHALTFQDFKKKKKHHIYPIL